MGEKAPYVGKFGRMSKLITGAFTPKYIFYINIAFNKNVLRKLGKITLLCDRYSKTGYYSLPCSLFNLL